MLIDNDKVHRIVVTRNGEAKVNMVYAEVGGEDHEVFGAFSGVGSGGGLFHQKEEDVTVVSDDPGEFNSGFDASDVQAICDQMERLRAEFEAYDDSGELIGLSELGLEFVRDQEEDENGIIEMYSEGASEDLIYDCQDDWNLGYYKA